MHRRSVGLNGRKRLPEMLKTSLGWQVLGSVIGAVGGLLGAWALLRSVWRERSKLVLVHKADPRWYTIDRNTGPTITVTMVISNRSSRPNAIIRYETEIILKDGGKQKLLVEQGQFGKSNSSDTLDFHSFGVTPMNTPPFSTVEAVLCFTNVDPQKYKYPTTLEITACDMYGKRFTGKAEFSS
jgi:hypothetical protein